jgi:hypothetical protein
MEVDVSWFLLFVFILVIIFLNTENTIWNKTERRELLFWWTITISTIFVIVQANMQDASLLTVCLITLISALPLILHIKKRVRKRLSRFSHVSSSNMIRDFGDPSNSPERVATDAALLGEIVQKMGVLKSSLREFGGYAEFSRKQVIEAERDIIERFTEISKDQLNQVILGINVPQLVKDIRDHIVGKNPPKYKAELLKVLCLQRLPEIKTHGRAVLLDAIQKVGFVAISDSDEYVANIICSTKGIELTNLKKLVDLGGDAHSFCRLIYNEVQSSEIRAKLLNHIKQEAKNLCEHYSEGKESSEYFLKVLSDIDDTLYCQLIDSRWPTKTFYPGVRKFYEELDKGFDQNDALGDLVFITARPHGYKGGIEKLTQEMLGNSKLHTQPVILAGSFSHFFMSKDMAKKKYENFEMYASIYPEYRFVFIGDSGQGDVSFGRKIKQVFENRVPLILIHGKNFFLFKEIHNQN